MRNASRMLRGVAAMAAMVLLLGGCGFAGDDNNDEGASKSGGAASEGPLKVGFIGPVTGEYAGFGEAHLDAVELAAKEWNAKGGLLGRQIEIDRGDSQGDPKQAATLSRRFVDDGIKAVVGPTFSLEAETAVPIFCQSGITAVTGLADLIDNAGSPCYFRTSLREDLSARFAARILTEYLKAKTVAIVDDGKSDTVRTADLLKEYLKGKAEVKFGGSISAGKQDYASTLTKIKSLDPDAVFLATTHPESALLRKQGTDLGLDTRWLLAAGSAESEFKNVAGERGAPSFSYDASRVAEKYDEFATAYEAEFGDPPGNYNEYAYDAANILFTAIDKAGSLDSAKVTEQLKAMKDFPGVTGPVTFDDTGSRGSELYDIKEYGKDGEWRVVKDAPFNSV
jgi:branched-chain amino acid transport system substrate-binding protein